MKSVIIEGRNEKVRVDEVEVGEPAEDEVRIKMAASGVCHSDYSVIDGTIDRPYPIILGHEGAGVVDKVGDHVKTLKPSDHVVLSYIPQCGKCYYCTTGKPNLCETSSFTGQGYLPNGNRPITRGGEPISMMTGLATMSEMTIVHETSAVPIDPNISLEKAALVGCGVMTGVGAAINTAEVQTGSSVAVFGSGGIGLNVIQGAVMSGANKIIAVDTNPLKLEFALRFGATHTVDASEEDPVERIREMTGGRGADYAFEAIGNGKVMLQAYECTRRAGTVTVIGIAKSDDNISIPASSLVRDEKRILGSFYGSTRQRVDLPRMFNLYQSGHLKLDELVTKTYKIDDAQEAFDDLIAGKNARGVLVF
ncbi:MAG: Zn-dependent alcohol dehydrogenase [Candidatus Latescibacterota bacterium]|nr:Zn-dependent alcohol dehydrogenase [Candidatus Latescibacterota bacterium]